MAHLLRSNGLLACLVEFLDSLLIIAKIFLATDENNGKSLAEVEDFRYPLEGGHVSAISFRVGGNARNDNV